MGEGQPSAREAHSDCRMGAAEPSCGIEQVAPRVKPWWKLESAPGMA